jgi:hypothetical protein
MKCQGCEKEFKHLPIRQNNFSYCGESCAHYDFLFRSKNMKSEKTGSSTTQEHGDQLRASSNDVVENENVLNATESEEQKRPDRGIGETRMNREADLEEIKQINGEEIQLDTDSKTMQEDTMPIPQEKSASSITNLDAALSQSTSICDQSIRSMHSLLNVVAENVHRKKVGEHHYVDPKLVNSACNVAAQMASLMKMKLQHHKMIRKYQKEMKGNDS